MQKKFSLLFLIVVSTILIILSCQPEEDEESQTTTTVFTDTTLPTPVVFSSIYPATGALVNTDQPIIITFSGNLDETLKGTIKLNGSDVDSSRITISSSIITILPPPDKWIKGATYTSIEVSGLKSSYGATVDTWGNPSYSFTVKNDDTPAPVSLLSITPNHGDTNVRYGVTIIIEFSVSLDTSIRGTVKLGSVDFPPGRFSISGTSISVVANGYLSYGQTYTGIDVSGFKSVSGQDVFYSRPAYTIKIEEDPNTNTNTTVPNTNTTVPNTNTTVPNTNTTVPNTNTTVPNTTTTIPETTTTTSIVTTTTTTIPAGSIRLTKFYISGLPSDWNGARVIVSGDGIGGWLTWTYDAATIKGTVNNGVFEYIFDNYTTSVDFEFIGVRLDGSGAPMWNSGGRFQGGTVGNTNDKNVGLTNPKNSKTYYIDCSISGSNWTWTLKEEIITTTTTTTIQLATPTGLTLGTVTQNSVALSWTAVPYATSYEIHQSASQDGQYNRITNVVINGTTATITGLTANTIYYYKVKATASGNSNYSDSLLSSYIYTKTEASNEPLTPLAKPTGLTPGTLTTSSVNFSWTAVPYATSYEIHQSTSAGGQYNIVTANVSISGTSVTITGLTSGSTYYYKVKAIGTGNYSDSELSDNITLTTKAITPLTPPTGLTLVTVTADSVTLSWGAVANATSYEVHQSIDNATYNKVTTNITITGTSATITGLISGNTYYYKVKAIGTGDYSNSELSSSVTANTPTTTTTTQGRVDWRDQIIYFIMTDRFYDGDSGNNPTKFMKKNGDYDSNANRYNGGDLKGIMDKVDYIKAMGATAIWITPVVSNTRSNGSYHGGLTGYWASDHSVLDETLAPNGYDATQRFDYYKNFVKTMHDNNILVIQDIVVNHMGGVLKYGGSGSQWDFGYNSSGPYNDCNFIQVNLNIDASGSLNEPSITFRDQKRGTPAAPFDNINFYHRRGKAGDDILGDLANLPDLATENPTVRSELNRIYSAWLDAGIDGYRIDTVKHVEDGFWDQFAPAIRTKANSLNKNFIQFGEAFTSSVDVMAKYTTGSRLDSMLNFDLYYKMQGVFAGGSNMGELQNELNTRQSKYSRGAIGNGGGNISAFDGAVNFIDNHDVDRFMESSNETNMRNALMYLMTTKGIPCIYYNTENDTWGTGETGAGDGRRPMPNFNMPSSNITGTPSNTKDTIAKLSNIRKAQVALRRGDMTINSASGDIIVFTRTSGSEIVVVAINKNGGAQNANIPAGSYTDLYNGGSYSGGSVSIPGKGCRILLKN